MLWNIVPAQICILNAYFNQFIYSFLVIKKPFDVNYHFVLFLVQAEFRPIVLFQSIVLALLLEKKLKQHPTEYPTRRVPTVGIAVVSMCDAAETLLSSGVPDLKNKQQKHILVIGITIRVWSTSLGSSCYFLCYND